MRASQLPGTVVLLAAYAVACTDSATAPDPLLSSTSGHVSAVLDLEFNQIDPALGETKAGCPFVG